MIFFDGVALESVASVMIDDIVVSPITFEELARPRSIYPGSEFVRSRAASRTVSITFALLSDDMNSRQASLMAIRKWAKTDKEYVLQLPGHPDHFLSAVCTSHPGPSLRQWWEANLTIVFTCFSDPYWNDRIEKSISCGSTFTVLGDAPPVMRIERTVSGSAASNQSYTLDNRTMTFSSIPVGSMVIDLNKQTAVVGSSSIMSNYNVNSKFLIPRTGTQVISGTGTVKYRERWE